MKNTRRINFSLPGSMRIFLLVLLMPLMNCLQAQQVVATAGSDYKSETMSISFTLGELVTSTYAASEWMITQGFHQPVLSIVSTGLIPEDELLIRVFPNPVADILFIEAGGGILEDLRYVLFDIKGHRLKQSDVSGITEKISFSGMIPGVYVLHIFHKELLVRQFRIIRR